MLILYSLVAVPFEIAFLSTSASNRLRDNVPIFVLGYLGDAFFATDMYLRLTVFVELHNCSLVFTPWERVRHYLHSGWFWVDLVSAFPFDLVWFSLYLSVIIVFLFIG